MPAPISVKALPCLMRGNGKITPLRQAVLVDNRWFLPLIMSNYLIAKSIFPPGHALSAGRKNSRWTSFVEQLRQQAIVATNEANGVQPGEAVEDLGVDDNNDVSRRVKRKLSRPIVTSVVISAPPIENVDGRLMRTMPVVRSKGPGSSVAFELTVENIHYLRQVACALVRSSPVEPPADPAHAGDGDDEEADDAIGGAAGEDADEVKPDA